MFLFIASSSSFMAFSHTFFLRASLVVIGSESTNMEYWMTSPSKFISLSYNMSNSTNLLGIFLIICGLWTCSKYSSNAEIVINVGLPSEAGPPSEAWLPQDFGSSLEYGSPSKSKSSLNSPSKSNSPLDSTLASESL